MVSLFIFHLLDVHGYLNVALICIFLMTNYAEHVFMCQTAIHISFLPECLNPLPIFKNSFVYLVSFESSTDSVYKIRYIMPYKYFLLVCGLSFIYQQCLLKSKFSFYSKEVQFICLYIMLLVMYLGNVYLTQSHKGFLLCFLKFSISAYDTLCVNFLWYQM